MIFMLAGMVSCGDNADFSTEHVLSQNEVEEIQRQDSIREAQKNSINANLILEYSVDITISKSAYDGVSLAIETDKIASLFGISVAELLAGIDGTAGAPEIKGFAIESSTHADYATSSNTNAVWGHWWDKNGDVVGWGDAAVLFAEFDSETGVFAIGQYPDHLTDGQAVTFIECLKYDEKRVAVVITARAHAAEEVKATVVRTQTFDISVIPNLNYDLTAVKFDLQQTFTDLGISSMDNVKFVGVNADGTYAQAYTTPNGFWYDMQGFVGPWGDGASVYTAYGEEEGLAIDEIGIGQMPGTMAVGESVTIKYGIFVNNKIEMLQITVTIAAYVDDETRPSGDPETITTAITLTKAFSDDYAAVEKDVADSLRKAFKLTTYEIFTAKNTGELKLYVNEESDATPAYTGDAPGFWFTEAGLPTSWGATSVMMLSLGGSETSLYLYGMNHPESCPPSGLTVVTKLIFTHPNGGKAIFDVTFIITAQE